MVKSFVAAVAFEGRLHRSRSIRQGIIGLAFAACLFGSVAGCTTIHSTSHSTAHSTSYPTSTRVTPLNRVAENETRTASIQPAVALYQNGQPVKTPLIGHAFSRVNEMEFSFYDFETHVMLHVTGPYRLVYWSEERVDLIAQIDSGLGGDAPLTLWHRDEELWAYMHIENTEYLTRVD